MTDFIEYISKVDAHYREKTQKFDCLFAYDDKKLSCEPLLRGVMYVIEDFLNSDKSSLFIKIPSFSLGKNKDDRDTNHCRFTRALADILYLATSEQLLQCKKVDNLNDGDIVYVSKKIPLPEHRGIDSSERFFKVETDNKRGQRAVEITELRSSTKWKHLAINMSVAEFIKDYEPDIIRLSSKPEGRWNGIVSKLNSFRETIDKYGSCNFSPQFKKALIVGTQKYFRTSIINDGCFVDCPVEFTSDFSTFSSRTDIELIIFTDNTYAKYRSSIQNKLNSSRDSLVKVIYVGNECEIKECALYEFSNREWFHYYVGDSKYPVIQRIHIEFPWLRQSVSSLREILETDQALSQDCIKNIVHRIFFPFMSSTFSNECLEESRIQEIMYEEYNFSPNETVLENVLNWYSEIQIPSPSPKEEWIANFKNAHRGYRFYVIPRFKSSYKRDVAAFIKKKNSNRNCYIFDGVRRCKIDVFTDLLEMAAQGTYYFLYYDQADIKYLDDYFKSEEDIYRKEHRRKILGGIIPKATGSNHIPQNGLDDYLEARLFDDIEEKTWNSLDNSYHITFDDDNVEILQGDVILNDSITNFDDIFNTGNFNGLEIVYYKSPEDFSKLISLYKGQLGKDEISYANLWKNALRKLYECQAHNNLDELYRLIPRVSKTVLGLYVKDVKSDRLFIKNLWAMRQVCNVLRENGYISQQDMNYILAAKKSREVNTKLGRKFKQELFDYFLNRGSVGRYPIIKKITEANNELSIDKIIKKSIFMGKIKNIQEYKTQNQDNGETD